MRRANTAEKYYETNAISMLVASALLGILLLGKLSEFDGRGRLILALIYFPLFIAPLIYYTVQFIYYYRVKLTDVQTVKLDRAENIGVFNLIGFRVDVECGGHKHYGAVTKHVFRSGGLINGAPLDRYSGRYMQVGYNEKRDEWIVLV